MALNTAGISAAIEALSISGVSIRDIDNLPETLQDRDCPLLFPTPGAWMEGSDAADEDETTFGTPSTRYWTVHTSLRYTYVRAQIGTGRGNSDHYNGAVTDIENIIEAVTALDVSGVDVERITHTPIGTVNDPASKKFIGCNFTFTFRQRINA